MLLHSQFLYLPRSSVRNRGLQPLCNVSFLPVLPLPHASALPQCGLPLGSSRNRLRPGLLRSCGAWSAPFPPSPEALMPASQGCFSQVSLITAPNFALSQRRHGLLQRAQPGPAVDLGWSRLEPAQGSPSQKAPAAPLPVSGQRHPVQDDKISTSLIHIGLGSGAIAHLIRWELVAVLERFATGKERKCDTDGEPCLSCLPPEVRGK